MVRREASSERRARHVVVPRPRLLAVAVGLLPGLYGPTDAAAQEAGQRAAPQIEEVVVSARRRVESAQDIPLSVSAFSQEELSLRNMTTGRDLSAMVPNLMIGAGGLGQNQSSLRIRGVPGVGVYLDGIWQGDLGVLQNNLVDMQRVEVLRGPQGTLFGRNTNGGAIQYVSALPAEEFGASLEAGLGRFDRRDVKLSVDVPLTENLLSKWTVGRFERDGYLKGVSQWDQDDTRYSDRNDTLLRGDLLWRASDAFSARLTVFDASQHGTEGRQVRFSFQEGEEWFVNPHTKAINWLMSQPDREYPADAFTPENYHAGWPGGEVGKWETKVRLPQDALRNDTQNQTLTLEWDINDVLSLRSLTARREQFVHQLSPQDGADFVACCRDDRYYDRELLSQEFHLTGNMPNGKISFLVGGYYSDAENKLRLYRWWHTEWYLPDANGDGNPELNVPLLDRLHAYGASIGDPILANYAPPGFWLNANHQWTRTDEEEKAFFGEVDWDITDRLQLTLGARWSWRDVVDNQFRPDLNDAPALFVGIPIRTPTEGNSIGPGDMWGGTPVPPAVPGINVISIDASFTPKVSLSYQWSDDVMVYGTYAEGFSEGGVTYVSALDQLFTLDPEIVESWELGIKSDLLDRRLRFNANAFVSDWNNLRVSRHPIDPNTGFELPTPFNTDDGQAEVHGFETEINWLLTDLFTLNFNGGYLKTKYIDIGDPDVSSLRFGAPFAYAPKRSYSVGAQYDVALPNAGTLTLRGDYGWQDEYERDPSVERHMQEGPEPAYGLLNMRFVYTPPAGAGDWRVALWGTNLTDEHYVDGGFVSAGLGFSLDTVGPPREYGISLEARF
jgi:iron complex outermembrane recepter protein